MAVAPASKAVLAVACIGMLSALAVATYLPGSSQRELAIGSLEKEAVERSRPESSTHGAYLERPTEHFRILYEGVREQAIGARLARVLEREYQRVSRTLRRFPSEPIVVMLYTNREFHDLTRAPAWSTGSYDGRIRLAVGGSAPEAELDRVVTHELVHAVIATAGHVPAWLNEGLATHLESSDPAWAAATLRGSAAVMPLADLVRGFSGFDEQQAIVAYAESAIAAEVLIAQLGSNLGPFLEMVGHGSSIDQALLEFHVQPNAFEAEWARRTGVR